jgi:hypothetical protein
MLAVGVLLAALMVPADSAVPPPAAAAPATSAAPPTAAAPSGPVVPVGSYNNFQFSGGRQSGFGADLWRSGGALMGVFIVAEGLQGQTPCGPVKVLSEPAAADVSFTVVVPMGRHSCAIHNAVPARDSITFQGRLTDGSLAGTVRRQEMLHPEVKASEGTIKLKRDKDTQLPTYPGRSEWERAELARCPQQ